MDASHRISGRGCRKFCIYDSYDIRVSYFSVIRSGGVPNIHQPWNLPAANWLINKYQVGDVASDLPGCTTPLTINNIQNAIWKLINTKACPISDVCCSALVAEALMNEHFVATCGDYVLKIMVSCDQHNPSASQILVHRVIIETGDARCCADKTLCSCGETGMAFVHPWGAKSRPIVVSDEVCPTGDSVPYSMAFSGDGKAYPPARYEPNCPMPDPDGPEETWKVDTARWGWEMVIGPDQEPANFILWAGAGNNNINSGFMAATGTLTYIPGSEASDPPSVKIDITHVRV